MCILMCRINRLPKFLGNSSTNRKTIMLSRSSIKLRTREIFAGGRPRGQWVTDISKRFQQFYRLLLLALIRKHRRILDADEIPSASGGHGSVKDRDTREHSYFATSGTGLTSNPRAKILLNRYSRLKILEFRKQSIVIHNFLTDRLVMSR